MYDILTQVSAGYRLMAMEAFYRPAAPGDGCGNITLPDQLNLEKEAADYAEHWNQEERKHIFRIGCCNYVTRSATIFAIEAARCMCAGNRGNKRALKLLELAVQDLKAVMEQQ